MSLRSLERGSKASVRYGLISLLLISIGTYFAFTKDIPFHEGYRIQAVFENSNLVAKRSPVRISGVDVGEVVEIERYKDTNYALVTMEIEDSGQPIHEDATMKVRPRLFIEGNFFVELHPGTGGSPEMDDGDVIPMAQTATPVQLDQLLTALPTASRKGLQDLLQGFGDATNSEPSAEDDADQDAYVQGLTGAQALNLSFDNSPEALRDSAAVNDALRGTEAHDLSKALYGAGKAMKGLGQSEADLQGLISDFNTTMAAMAQEAPDLERTVELLGPTAHNARAGFSSLDAALPNTRAFAREILPGVEQTLPVIDAAGPWIDQALPFFGDSELGGLLSKLRPAQEDMAVLAEENRQFLPVVDRFNKCVLDVIIPTGNIKVDDGEHSVPVENYKEFWYATVAQAGEAQGFDGNGSWLRVNAATGDKTLVSGKTNYTGEPYFTRVSRPPLRTSPAFPNKVPPLQRDEPCHKQPIPDVNGDASVGPADGSSPRAAAPKPPGLSATIASVSKRFVPLSEVGR